MQARAVLAAAVGGLVWPQQNGANRAPSKATSPLKSAPLRPPRRPRSEVPTFQRLFAGLRIIWHVPSTTRASRPLSCSARLLNLAIRCRQYSSSVSGPGSSPAAAAPKARGAKATRHRAKDPEAP